MAGKRTWRKRRSRSRTSKRATARPAKPKANTFFKMKQRLALRAVPPPGPPKPLILDAEAAKYLTGFEMMSWRESQRFAPDTARLLLIEGVYDIIHYTSSRQFWFGEEIKGRWELLTQHSCRFPLGVRFRPPNSSIARSFAPGEGWKK